MEDMDIVSYASNIGNLIYVMVYTCTYIVQALQVVRRFMTNPRKEHWKALKWLLRFLKDTSEVSMYLRKTGCLGRIHRYILG